MYDYIKNYIEEEFEYLHQHPELSFEEYETTKRLKDDLSAHEIGILPLDLKTGAVGLIGQGERTIALRADIDALPIEEQTSLPYKSVNKGIMHACGHDSHAAIMLGAALILKAQEQELSGKVKIIFQPAEEAPGGALEIIRKGGLDEVEAIFGLHCTPLYETGVLGIKAGPTHAAVEKFKIELKGRGTHAAHPDAGNDVILAGSHFIATVQSIVSRNTEPTESAIVSITHFQAGNTWTVLPETAFLEGTIRTFAKEERALCKRRFTEILNGIAEAFGIKAELTWVVEVPATDNDPYLAELAINTAKKMGFETRAANRSLGGEDFSLYQQKVRGLFTLVGTGISYPNHNPHFEVDKKALYPASLYIATLAKAYLEAKNEF